MSEALHMGQEEYIWAMKTYAQRKDLPAAPRSYSDDLRATTQRVSRVVIDPITDYQTKVMASLVPDEVINNVDDYRHRHYDSCLLFGDVSGFTELCEKYTKTGVSGPSRVTQALNKYLGTMVQEIMSHNGDVLKFSGDAFLAVFKCTESQSMRDAVHEALDCALLIQKHYGSYTTDVGVVIRVKLAVSAGPVIFALIGTSRNSHYVIVGPPVWDVKTAESISSPGEIIVAPAAWCYVNTTEYLYEECYNNIHIKLTGVGLNWRSVQKNIKLQEPQESQQDDQSIDELSEDDIDHKNNQDTGLNEDFSLRPAVNTAVRLRIKKSLKRFIFPPVMKSIGMNEPFEYLTEMRQAVIVCINVITDRELTTEETVILADQSYKTVCKVVENMNGCVNKVSFFDKDLMFVVIFGLRGFKHELECQAALRCASECHKAIFTISGVLSVSIGVTTGKTYCGVFGHTLRREYTVISLIVNKAARLMVNYKNKVTCDRESFLHSKLEAKHFILQEYKYLKGISQPGPIYEFNEIKDPHHHINLTINACPLLGRSSQLKLYDSLLKENIANSTQNTYKMFIIRGEARQGKSRLLDEIVYKTPKTVEVNKFILSNVDLQVPYVTIRLIFNNTLQLVSESSVAEKEEKLMNVLHETPASNFLWVINEVFQVNFQKPYETEGYDEKQLLQTLLKHLGNECFKNFWVVAIDNCQFIDEWSSELFASLLDISNIFIVATMAREHNTYPVSNSLINHPRVKTDYLRPVDRVYLGALACQILDVYALSPELENAIQNKSNGNPGWIESFLTSLSHDNGLYIVKATLAEIEDLGLVCPPLYMMARLSQKEKQKWQTIMEEQTDHTEDANVHDNWHKYIDSCRDTHLNVTARERMDGIEENGQVPICVVSKNFSVEDTQMELSMDTMVLKTFDSLDSFEQLLVKCSAILGNQFYRLALIYVMNTSEIRQVALAIQKLFEIRVLACAKGDFIEGGTPRFKEKFIDPTVDPTPICYCRGLKIADVCVDLPKYASCGYLIFISPLYRDITYNLLTDNQKKDFHLRALKYLKRETRKCRACGYETFDKIIGFTADKDLLGIKQKQKHEMINETEWNYESDVESKLSTSRGSVYSISTSFSGYSGYSGSVNIPSISGSKKFDSLATFKSHSKNSSKEDLQNSDVLFGRYTFKKLSSSESLTRPFSIGNLSECQCDLILFTAYAQLINHCIGAGELVKSFLVYVEYATLCIFESNLLLALKLLDEAISFIDSVVSIEKENMWQFSLFRAKFHTTRAYCRLELGQYDQAEQDLQSALAIYNLKFPRNISKHLRLCFYKIKQFICFYMFPKAAIKKLEYWDMVYIADLGECLTQFASLYILKGDWRKAEVAATWSLIKALESFSNFQLICNAFTNMLCVAQHFKRYGFCTALEKFCLKFCHLKQNSMKSDIQCVIKLYCAVFYSRIKLLQLDKAIHIGNMILRFASAINCFSQIFPLLSVLLYLLLLKKDFITTLYTSEEINLFADASTDNSGHMWYYATCLGLQLETGFTLVSYQTCDNFYDLDGKSCISIKESDAQRRFYTVMWLWCVRNDQWDAATIWCSKLDDFFYVTEENTVENHITALYVLEGVLLYLVSKMDRYNISAALVTERDVRQLIKTLEKISKKEKILLPRLYHLKAYYRYLKKYDSKVTQLLNKALYHAKKQGNFLEEAWIEHSRKAWNRELSSTVEFFWKEHADSEHIAEFQNLDINEHVGFFTLPTPMYE